MRQYAFLVVRPQLSSSNPNFSKPRTRTANSDFWSRLTHQLLVRLKFTVTNLQFYLPKMANSEKLGLGIDNPCRIVILSLRTNKCLERVKWPAFLESWSLQLRNDTTVSPQLKSYIFIITSILYGRNHEPYQWHKLLLWRQKRSCEIMRWHRYHWIALDVLFHKTPIITSKTILARRCI
jgi:hypothetical protein